jgi:metal-responsive CopG/Arc/MetJ family transcriptional regulator
MKLAISIPNEIFQEAEAFAKKARSSRSSLYAQALTEFMSRHSADRVTEAMDQVVDAIGQEQDGFLLNGARRTLERNEW